MPKAKTNTEKEKKTKKATVKKSSSTSKKTSTKSTTKKSTSKKTTAKKTAKTSKTSKTTSNKKSTSKKAPAKKTTTKKASLIKKVVYKQSAAEKKLVKELNEMASQMDAEGLVFLIEQARVHLYNMEVVALQEEVNKINEQKADLEVMHDAKSKSNKFDIKRSADGSVYHVIHDGKWKMINAEELLKILKIVNAPVEDNEIRLNILHWFFKERSDFVGDFALTDTHDPRWLSLIDMFKNNFQLHV